MNINIPIREIVYIQAEHVYVRIFMANRQELLYRSSLGALLKQLPSSHFLQVHRSYVINTNFVERWSKEEAYLHNCKIPISRNRRVPVKNHLSLN